VVMMDDGWRYFLMFLWMIRIKTHQFGEGLGYTVMELTEFDRS